MKSLTRILIVLVPHLLLFIYLARVFRECHIMQHLYVAPLAISIKIIGHWLLKVFGLLC